MVIEPTLLVREGKIIDEVLAGFAGRTRGGGTIAGDFSAQVSANRSGIERLQELVVRYGRGGFVAALRGVDDYAARLAEEALSVLPHGEFEFTDLLDDDGCGNTDLAICVTLRISATGIDVDFAGTAPQTEGNVNCPLSVAAAAVYYCFRCLMPPQTPAAAGSFRRIRLHAPRGVLVNARSPAAVAAGNVETSSRIVDTVLGALAQALPDRIPAASQGTMNNLAMGGHGARLWDYYETLGGGMGAGPEYDGLSAVQSHMTNTLNTPIEVLEMNYPLRVWRYALRHGSGGSGRHCGGDGLVREYEFLEPATVTLLTERRTRGPWGLGSGADGVPGRNLLDGKPLGPKVSFGVASGSCVTVETPGGGGWGP
jgi:N-methylhydantoinase B